MASLAPAPIQFERPLSSCLDGLPDRTGRIAYKLAGPISEDNLEAVLKPQLEKAMAAP